MPVEQENHIGEIVRVNGPIVLARQMEHAGMQEVVEVGRMRLMGEVIKVRNGQATIQVYENTSGLRPGEPVHCSGRPLSAPLPVNYPVRWHPRTAALLSSVPLLRAK